jgi:hypothetical protein
MRRFGFLLGSALLCLPAGALAAQSFSDVGPANPHYTAIEFLQENGILTGYPDGTFRPDQTVNRAEVMKIIVGNSADALTGSGSSFKDVPATAWYSPYVETAYTQLRIIDGPPVTTFFRPERAVTRAEFLKMLLLAYDTDPVASYGEITYPLSPDTASAQDWYYPYLRYGVSAAMVETDDGLLNPAEQLKRADIAEILYRFLLYREGKQTQTLLSAVENDVLSALLLVNDADVDPAHYAAARAILAARGALSSRPDDATVKAAVKTAEGTMALIDSADALQSGKKDKAIDGANTAWHLGGKAMEFSSALKQLDLQLQNAATKLADEARTGN